MAARFLTPLLGAIAAGVVAASHPVCAAGLPVWQPYRETVTTLQPTIPDTTQIDPTQYVVVAQPQGLPLDAVTDDQLDRLSTPYCCEPFATANSEFDPIIGMQSTNVLIAASPSQGSLEILPKGLIWHSYWAGVKEPRTSGTVFQETGNNLTLLDVSLGGRSSILRQALRSNQGLWRGWELQIEGAAILRLNLDENLDFDATDFRFGVPLILARNQLLWKFAYYHLSSHVGDEFLVRNPAFKRINFSRDVLVWGASYFPLPAWRWYAEAGWAFYDDEGSDPWEFQFGLDYARPGPTGKSGTPFVALNGHIREDVNFGGNLALQAGWLWRGQAGRVVRTGLHYYNGKSSQFEFFDNFEQQIGFGLWQEY